MIWPKVTTNWKTLKWFSLNSKAILRMSKLRKSVFLRRMWNAKRNCQCAKMSCQCAKPICKSSNRNSKSKLNSSENNWENGNQKMKKWKNRELQLWMNCRNIKRSNCNIKSKYQSSVKMHRNRIGRNMHCNWK